MKKHQIALAILSSGIAFTSSQATVIFFDDMESYSIGNDQNISGGPRLYSSVGVANQATATPFGSPNQFMYLDGGSSFSRVNSATTLMTYSFDVLEPTTAQSGTNAKTRFGIGAGDINNKAYAAWSINDGVITTLDNTSLVSGSLPTLAEDRHYTAYIVYNGSGSSETIAGSGATLAAGETALYFYDTVSSSLINGGIYSHTASITPSSFLVRSFSADDNTLYYDNITQQDVLQVIPEPSTYAILFGSIALLIVTRRKSRQA